MIPVTSRSAQRVAVFGLGASGRAAARALLSGGAEVAAWDDAAGPRAAAGRERIPLVPPERVDWPGQSALVLSPGVPLTGPEPHPVVAAAAAAGVAVVGDIELLAETRPDAVLVAVTGTNGKSTTAALIHHVCERAGLAAQIGGNFGRPALDLDPPGAGDPVILEVSSFQLDLTRRAAFDVAVLLNLTPDHLDRHGGMAGYRAAKRRIFRRAGDGRPQVAIVGADDAECRAVLDGLAGDGGRRVRAVSAERRLADGVHVADGTLRDADDGAGCDLSAMEGLRGPHNWQNAAAAWAASRALGVAPETVRSAFADFGGLPHRMETVAVIDGVRYVNDSKATNGDAAARALASFGNVYWIAGGRDKGDGLGPVGSSLGNVRGAYLIGEAEAAFARELEGRVPVARCGTLENAVAAARRRAVADGAPDPVVLLSPACASFDQHESFAARGDRFRALALGEDRGGAS